MSKENIVVISQYMPGIYPPGEDDVATHLLAGLYIKSFADADPEISKLYNIFTFDFATTLDPQEIAKKIRQYRPKFLAYSLYMWNYHEFVESSQLLKKEDPSLLNITHITNRIQLITSLFSAADYGYAVCFRRRKQISRSPNTCTGSDRCQYLTVHQ